MSSPNPDRKVSAITSVALDVVAVGAFIALGRKTHAETGLAGFFNTLWPFLVGLVAGWVALSYAHTKAQWRVFHPWPAGAVVWLATAGVGLGVRAVSGGGISGGFPLVAIGVIGVLVIGWRLVTIAVLRFR